MYYTRRNIIDCLTNSRNNYTWCHTPFRRMRWTTKLITPVVMHNSRKWAEQYFLANSLFASIVCVDRELRKFGQYGNHLQYHVSSPKQITRSKSYAKWQTNHSSNFPFSGQLIKCSNGARPSPHTVGIKKVMIFQICECKWIGISSAKSDEYTIRSIRSDFMNGRVHRNIKCDVSWELESKQNSLNDKSHFYICISSLPVWCGHLLVRTITPPPHPHTPPPHTHKHTHTVKVKTIVTILSMCIMYWHCKAYIVSIGVYSDKTSQRHPGFAARLDHKGTMV